MRCMPLIVWASSLTRNQDIYRAHKADAEFTHPDVEVHDAIFIYSITIKYLLDHPNDPDRA